MDLTVPHEVLNLPGIRGQVYHAVEVGSELWISVVDSADFSDGQGSSRSPQAGSGGQVARYANGRWKVMSDPGDGVGGRLAADSESGVWAGGVTLASSSGSQAAPITTVRRWDGSAWRTPAAGSAGAPADGEVGDVVADPRGGVWLLSAEHLRRFDGSQWQQYGRNNHALWGGAWTPDGGTLAVASNGDAWLAWAESVARVSADGAVTRFGRGEGIDGVQGMAVGGDRFLVFNHPEVLRLIGARFATPHRLKSAVGGELVLKGSLW